MEEIKINDKVYILKEEYNKLVDEQKVKKPAIRFSPKDEVKILNAINNLFSCTEENTISEEEAVKNGAVVIDPANVCLVSGKSERAKRLLSRFIGSEEQRRDMPKWDFIPKDKQECKSRYSMEYFNKIIKVFSIKGSEAVTVSLLYQHPFQIEDEDFAFVLAPRIEGEITWK